MSTAYFLIGKTLGKYQIVRHLGHGGMAEVFLGEQVHLDRQVAIKILHPFLAEESGFVNRFQREARIVATLRHPNIVQVYDFDLNEEFGVYYMVMEYIEGPTLRERFEAGEVSLEEGVHIIAAIADALEYAHRRQMVHRDIKPANILFTSEGQPVLTDFGIARMLSLTGLTASGAMVGTPAYMAPEIGIGHPGTALSDIYSLGVVLYQLVTGQLPFNAEVPMALVMKHINEPVPPPSQINPDLPQGLEPVILKMLMKQPEKRFLTAGEAAAALRGVMGWKASPTGLVSTAAAARATTRSTHGTGEEVASANSVSEGPEAPLLRRVSPHTTNPPNPANPKPVKTTVSPLTHALRAGLGLLAVVLLGLAAWSAILGELPSTVLGRLITGRHSATGAVSAVMPTDAIATSGGTRRFAPTWTPAPTDNPTPTNAANCVHRAEVLQVDTVPRIAVLPPQTIIRADITLRNGGACDWPAETRLALFAGDAFGASNSMLLRAVPVGEKIQLQLYLRAPNAPGAYRSTWEVQLPDGRAISSPIAFNLTVGDLPTFTPSALIGAPPTPIPTAPLIVITPTLREWAEYSPSQTWRGTLDLSAEGGTGHYRFYHKVIRADAGITDDVLHFEWSRCTDFPLTLIVVSGEAVVRWEGIIAYPAPEQCK